MRKLDRTAASEPACLAFFEVHESRWENLSWEHREEIRGSLATMQGSRCAYCEGSLDELGKHIEHFCQRSRHPDRTFDWTNLFLSCNRNDSCGRYKDQCPDYACSDLVNPCQDDPDRFFRFNSDGSIWLKQGLDARDTFRAEETLRVFNLDARRGRLRAARHQAVLGYQQTLEDLSEYAKEFPESDWLPFLQHELERASQEPFSTAIRHALVGRTA